MTVLALLYFIWPGLCSETFAIFACRDVCGQSLLRADINQTCWEGRHANYAVLGVIMIIVYVIGFPLVAFSLIARHYHETSSQRISMVDHDDHTVLGMLYSAFDPKVWWWELTVALRKIAIAGIGVFGTGMREMQVLVTLCIITFVIVLTALIKPYGHRVVLQWLEMGSLMTTWMTLWAGSTFNVYPHCKSESGAVLGWCNTLSWLIALMILTSLVLIVACVVYYKNEDFQNICKARCHVLDAWMFGQRRRRKLIKKESERRIRFETSEICENPFEEMKVVEMMRRNVVEVGEVGGEDLVREEMKDAVAFTINQGDEEALQDEVVDLASMRANPIHD